METFTMTITHKPTVRPKVTYGKAEKANGLHYNLTAFDRSPAARKMIESAPIGAVVTVVGTETTNAKGDRQIIVETIGLGDKSSVCLNPEPDFDTLEAVTEPFDFGELIAAGWVEVPYPAKWIEPGCRYLLSPAQKGTYELNPDGHLKFVLPYNL